MKNDAEKMVLDTRIKMLDIMISAVESGTWVFGEHSASVEEESHYIFGKYSAYETAWRAYCGSLDAAENLHNLLLPGYHAEINTEGNSYVSDYAKELFSAKNDVVSRSWLISQLQAFRSKILIEHLKASRMKDKVKNRLSVSE